MKTGTDSIFEKVKDCLCKALEVDPDSVSMESKLMVDLGAESIDFLDIVFRLERVFSIKIPRDDLFPEKVLSDPQYVQNGQITPAGVALLKEKLSTLDLSGFEKNPLVSKLPDLFSVKMIVDYLTRRLNSHS